MSIPFANFDQTSPLGTSPHDPMIGLISNCIRDYFGPTVQMIADALLLYNGSSLSSSSCNGTNATTCNGSVVGVVGNVERLTLHEIVQVVRARRRATTAKVYSQERIRLLGKRVASRLENQYLQLSPIRAALLVLIQHSIVTVTQKKQQKRKEDGMEDPSKENKNKSTKSSSTTTTIIYYYEINKQRARLLPRYPKYIEYAKKALDDKAAIIIEELLCHGQLRTIDILQKTIERLLLQLQQINNNNNNNNHNNNALHQAVFDSFKRLKQAGFIEEVPTITERSKKYNTMNGNDDDDDDDDGGNDKGEYEFEGQNQQPPTRKKIKLQREQLQQEEVMWEEEDPILIKLIKNNMTISSAWRVNVHMFHDSLRAFILGRLVAERYGHKVQSAGSMITAALKYIAHVKHVERKQQKQNQNDNNFNNTTAAAAAAAQHSNDELEQEGEETTFAEDEDWMPISFDAASIIRYMPKPVVQLLEKKIKASTSSPTTNKNINLSIITLVAKSLQQLSGYNTPNCIQQVEVGGKPEDSKFEINVLRMKEYLQQRIINQMIIDHHGEVAARIVTILTLNGHLESDSLAEAAMVPAKDTREILHRLYRTKYINLFTLNTSRQHNPSNMIYLWSVVRTQIIRTTTDNVCTALLNLRLRRQHQVELGKNWIERAQEAGDMDENDHEADKLNHRKFCLGLERLYNACLQLDETLMVLEDF